MVHNDELVPQNI